MTGPNAMPPPNLEIKIFPSAEALSVEVANTLRKRFQETPGGRRALMLSGGSTPLAAYRILMASPPPVSPQDVLFLSDDRYVATDSDKSNQKQIAPLLAALGLGPEQFVGIPVTGDILKDTASFGMQLQPLLESEVDFDLGFLGMGADGHTAGLFTPAHLDEAGETNTLAVDRPDGLRGITVGPAILRRFRRLVFLIAGEAKGPALKNWLNASGPVTAAKAVQGASHVEWWLDVEAAEAAGLETSA